MIDIYISCAVTDRGKARLIAAILHMQGYSVAPATLLDRTANLNDSETAMDARCVIVIWTQASIGSQPVRSDASIGAQRNCLIEIAFGPHRAHIDGVSTVPIDFMKWDGSAHERQWRQLSQQVRDFAGGGNGRAIDRNSMTQLGVIGALVTVSVGVMALTLPARLEGPTQANDTPSQGQGAPALATTHTNDASLAEPVVETITMTREAFESAQRAAKEAGELMIGPGGGPSYHTDGRDQGWMLKENQQARTQPAAKREPAEEKTPPEPIGPAP